MRSISFRGACAALILAFTPLAAQAQSVADRQREDIEFLRTEYIPRERAFTPEGRANALRIIDELAAQAGSLTNEQLFLGFLRVNAAADNSHSMARYNSNETAPQTRLPLAFAWFEDSGLVILRALPPHADLVGARVLEIEGRPAEEVFRGLMGYFGGPDVRRTLMATRILVPGGLMQAAGFADSADTLTMRLRLADGSEVEREIAYVPAANVGATAWWPSRWWSPEPINNDATPWATAIPATNLPLYLQNADAYNRAVALPELDAVYLDLKSNEADRDAREFADRSNAVLRTAHATNLIVDLRFSAGGDMRTTAAFLEQLPSRVQGRIFVIVGRYTFSAGMASAEILINAAGDRATVVGEDVGDRMRFWSEGDGVCSPNYQFCARYTDGLFDMERGCEGEPRCYADNRRYDLVGSLTPTLRAPMTWEAYLAGRDPAMDAIRTALGR